MNKSTFQITQMDCAAEEQMIRMRLEEFTDIQSLDFDLPNRQLVVYHLGEIQPIQNAIRQLKFNDTLIDIVESEAPLLNHRTNERTIL